MIVERTSRLSPSAVTISLALALSVSFPTLCAGQTSPPAPPTNVFSNPRASSDDPRVGLKGGLYDAGEAAFGMERLASLTKPPGFAPGDTAGARRSAAWTACRTIRLHQLGSGLQREPSLCREL
jgi:hypothetical protein